MPLDPNVKREVTKSLEQYEGRVKHFYLDTVGKVTIGVGHYVSNRGAVTSFPMYKVDTQGNLVVASVVEKQADYDSVAKQRFGKLFAAQSFKKYTSLFMLDGDINAQRDNHIKSFYQELSSFYTVANGFKTKFDGMPPQVQRALFDMVFNLGLTKLKSQFTKFNRAIKSEKWDVAASESSRTKIDKSRNLHVENLFMLAHSAAIATP